MNSCHLMSSPREPIRRSKDLAQVESLNAVIPLGLAFKGLREAGKPWGAPGTQLCWLVQRFNNSSTIALWGIAVVTGAQPSYVGLQPHRPIVMWCYVMIVFASLVNWVLNQRSEPCQSLGVQLDHNEARSTWDASMSVVAFKWWSGERNLWNGDPSYWAFPNHTMCRPETGCKVM